MNPCKKPPCPRGYARAEGRKDGVEAHRARVLSTGRAVPWAVAGQTVHVGDRIEVYDALSWAPYTVSEEDNAAYLRGYASAVSDALGQPVYLVYRYGRGNGHNDYEIQAGYGPPPRRHGGRRQRRAHRTREMQKMRRLDRWHAFVKHETEVLLSTLMQEGRMEWNLRTEAACRVAVKTRRQPLRPGYAEGESREKALASLRAQYPVLTAVQAPEVVDG